MSKKVKHHVKSYVAAFVNMPVDKIEDEYVLKEHPLKLDDLNLRYLAYSLRGYIKNIKPGSTISVTEVRKKDLTVQKLYELVKAKIS